MTAAFPQRRRVLWFGSPPSRATIDEFVNRNLVVENVDELPGDHVVAYARGAVFAFDDANLHTLAAVLDRSFPTLTNHGVLINISSTTDALQGKIAELLGSLSTRLDSRRTAPRDHEFAERIARHEPGPSYPEHFEPKYFANIEPLSDEDRFLLGRALDRGGEMVIDEMGGGLSDARVLRVLTTAGASNRSWVQPYFAKIDRPDKILLESRNYQAAEALIPFWLRPNISRTVEGATRAVMVGNLVDKSESLWDVVRRGQGEEAIFNLFNTTLGAFRSLGLQSDPVQGNMLAALEKAGIVSRERIRTEYAPSGGGAMGKDAIWQILSEMPHQFSSGIIHGDLHAENVRVRGVDAILIDLASMRDSAPLMADLAMLETWLAFGVHKKDQTDGYEDSDWKAVVEKLYHPQRFIQSPSPPDAPTKWQWMMQSVRQIRSLALADQRCQYEYTTAVIAALLRQCMFQADSACVKFRRTTAYTIAGQLALALKSR